MAFPILVLMKDNSIKVEYVDSEMQKYGYPCMVAVANWVYSTYMYPDNFNTAGVTGIGIECIFLSKEFDRNWFNAFAETTGLMCHVSSTMCYETLGQQVDKFIMEVGKNKVYLDPLMIKMNLNNLNVGWM